MKNAINTLRIQNFKSIKDVTMKPRRVNLIIGQPNVGKSNILEAMSLLGGMVYDKKRRFMEGMVRYERASQLFFDNLIANTVRVETDHLVSFVSLAEFGGGEIFEAFYSTQSGIKQALKAIDTVDFAYDLNDPFFLSAFLNGFRKAAQQADTELVKRIDAIPILYTWFDKSGLRPKGVVAHPLAVKASADSAIRPYLFAKNQSANQEYRTRYLEPPSGDNLKNIIQTYPALRQDVAKFFAQYGLKLMLHMENKQLEVIKDLDGVIYSYPYSSSADTLQRIIFYLAAIESNDDAVILLEEPEAHSYPVYVSMLGRRMVESRNNQFFVATHSPYLITEILEQMLPDEEQAQELAIFVAYYEDYQTKVKQLSDEEVRDIRADSVDVFYNMDRYIPLPSNG